VTTLDTPLPKSVVGLKAAKALDKAFGMATIGDLLRHYPRRYEKRGELTDIASLVVGEEVTIQAVVEKSGYRRMRDRKAFVVDVTVKDESEKRLSLTFFAKEEYQAKWRANDLRAGRIGMFAGTVSEFNRVRQLTHPEYVMLSASDDSTTVDEFAGMLIPVYPSTKDLRSWKIAEVIKVVLDVVQVTDPMPTSLRVGRRLTDLLTALREIHRPNSWEMVGAAKKRLKWDEAFAVQLALVQRQRRSASSPATPRPRRGDGLLSTFDSALPYRLTQGQITVGEEISADLSAGHPMHRLLQGEVGSGKTLCALRGMLQVVDSGGQAALLAPTEVLAAQHHRSIRELLGPIGRAGELDSADQATRVVLVTGSQAAAARRQARAEIASGEAGIVIGTHALLYEGVDFADLGLVVVDEQHRFGVEQRDALRAKASGEPPHVLVMTATPIPRTVAMTVFGDLEISTLTELPAGRASITTHVVPAEKPAHLARGWQRLREEVEKGHQAYVVCPRIGGEAAPEDTPSTMDISAGPARRPPIAVLEVEPLLAADVLSGLRIGVLHGRLPGDEKDAVMRDFAAGKIDVLIATTVIEVGVDVPNATMMVVLDADRFGVSQLHQLRGRIGRGDAPGLCLLVTDAEPMAPARERLDAVASTLDGFRLAELDLAQRREGDVLGEAQSGRRSHLRLLSLLHDREVIEDARREATDLLDRDPELVNHPALAAAVAAFVDEERAEFLEKG
jgi:ATP-dependent DNA helicase RecG